MWASAHLSRWNLRRRFFFRHSAAGQPGDDHCGRLRTAQDRHPRQAGTNRIELWGTIPADDLGLHEQLAIEDPAEFCARLLAELLSRRG